MIKLSYVKKGIIFAGICLVGFVGCKKDEIKEIENSANTDSYSSYDDLFSEMDKKLSLSLDELRSYESSKGITSFGRFCDELYEGVNDSSLKNNEDLLKFVAKNSDYLELIKDENGDVYLETTLGNNEFRYITDINRIYTLQNRVYKVFKEGHISTTVDNKNELKSIKSYNEERLKASSNLMFHPHNTISSEIGFYDEGSLKSVSNCGRSATGRNTSGRDRTKVEIKLNTGKDSDGNLVVWHHELARPYKRHLGVWIHCTRTISYQFKFQVETQIFGGPMTTRLYDRSGTRFGTSVEGTVRCFTNSGFQMGYSDYYYTKYDCWAYTPSTGAARVRCNL